MGIYVNPKNEYFKEVLNSKIFVDKSKVLENVTELLNSQEKFVCLSRPRRFGKTIATMMMVAYFSKGCDSRSLFENLEIAKSPNFEKHLNKHNVIQIDVNDMFSRRPANISTVEFMRQEVNSEIEKEFNIKLEGNETIPSAILKIYEKTGERFIILIDEYDVLVREKNVEKEFKEYLAFLNAFFKSSSVSQAIELAYLTGILPIVRDRIESKLNLFTEYTMIEPDFFAENFGFTTEDVKTLCEKFNVDFEECKRWYDGYKLEGIEIYNPKAICSVMRKKKFISHWGKTGSFEAVSDYIALNFDGTRDDVLKMLVGKRVYVNVSTFLNTKTDFKSKHDVFTYLIHLGYLAYDPENEECYIPNHEIKLEWESAVRVATGFEEIAKVVENSRDLLIATQNGETEAVAQYLDNAHTTISNNLNYNNEGTLQSAIIFAYLYARGKYSVLPELTTGKGYADVVFLPYLPSLPAIIVELKVDESPSVALNQIKSKQYFKSLEKYTGDLLLVGIDYNKTSKKHSCRIEKFTK